MAKPSMCQIPCERERLLERHHGLFGGLGASGNLHWCVIPIEKHSIVRSCLHKVNSVPVGVKHVKLIVEVSTDSAVVKESFGAHESYWHFRDKQAVWHTEVI